MCRGVPSCPWGTRGAALDPDLWDFCGASRSSSAACLAGRSGTSGPAHRGRFAARPEWLAVGANWVPSGPLAHPGGGRLTAKTAVFGVGHDAVVGPAGAGAAGAGAVAAEHLRGGSPASSAWPGSTPPG